MQRVRDRENEGEEEIGRINEGERESDGDAERKRV